MRNEDWRAEIDSIDNELLRLLNRRARLAVGTHAAADEHGTPAQGAARGGDVLERACRVNAGPLDELAVVKIFRRIIHETQHAAAPHWHTAEPLHEEAGELV
ncbi:MAG TPA: chorismate mutase [Pyrinomonadaceae bacterium]|nr:chorismate mutase [Pyrinomonadaceae bacterium]